jgi:hypothetical protein
MNENFKQMAAEDIADVFFNPEEFGEIHQIDGKPMTVIVDGLEVVERSKKQSEKGRIDGIYKKQILLYVSRKEMGILPAIGRQLQLDNNKYLVTDAIDESGVFSITLGAVKS